jgi:hypothetical protein
MYRATGARLRPPARGTGTESGKEALLLRTSSPPQEKGLADGLVEPARSQGSKRRRQPNSAFSHRGATHTGVGVFRLRLPYAKLEPGKLEPAASCVRHAHTRRRFAWPTPPDARAVEPLPAHVCGKMRQPYLCSRRRRCDRYRSASAKRCGCSGDVAVQKPEQDALIPRYHQCFCSAAAMFANSDGFIMAAPAAAR